MSPNPYEDESWTGYHRDSEPCDCGQPSDEEHLMTCIFWRAENGPPYDPQDLEVTDGDVPF